MKIGFYKKNICMGLLTIGLLSCEKQNYNNGFVNFAEVYFLNMSVLQNNLGLKYEGEPIAWDNSDGKVKVPEGEKTFVFYNKSTGEKLAERTVNVVTGAPQTFLIFQPTVDAPLAFLDPDGQANEDAAPEGFMKIKIANLSEIALPNEQIDIVFNSTTVNLLTYRPVDTIEFAIGRNLEAAQYALVKKGVRNGQFQTGYKLSFLNHETKAPILNAGGSTFMTTSTLNIGSPAAPKSVFTVYLTDFLRPNVSNVFLLRGNKYYDITFNRLFTD